MRDYRGTLTEPGKDSPYRDRRVEENLDLFARMRAGEFADGAHVLRAKIDMASPNINMRDPVIYRIRRAPPPPHRRRVVHLPDVRLRAPLSDAIEGITHSLCTLEFEDHRPLYDWLLDEPAGAVPSAPDRVRAPEPDLHGHEQAQAARSWCRRGTSAAGTTRACRRSPACAGAATRRRRSANFCDRIGVAKRENVVDVALLEHCRPRGPEPARAARHGACSTR